MSVQASWLLKGFFDLSDDDQHNTTTNQIKTELCSALGLPAGSLRTKSWPVGPAWRNTFWWREGETDYAEAQYYLNIPERYPVLSLGVTVEKGREESLTGRPGEHMADRSQWDWQRLAESRSEIVSRDVPTVAKSLGMPLNLRFRVHVDDREDVDNSRAFSYVGSQWFWRHKGTTPPQDIADHIDLLDQQRGSWVDTFLAVDLAPAEVDGMSAREVALLLVKFEPIRRRLRGRAQ